MDEEFARARDGVDEIEGSVAGLYLLNPLPLTRQGGELTQLLSKTIINRTVNLQFTHFLSVFEIAPLAAARRLNLARRFNARDEANSTPSRGSDG